jgi:AcrR family transcriptional regulator
VTAAETRAAVCRPGGRSARVQAAVYRATRELVGERGHDQITIPLIAARAGVNPTTVYRRWGDLPQLLSAVAANRLTPDTPLPDTGDLRADLQTWAADLLADLATPDGVAFLRSIAATERTGRNQCLRDRAEQIQVLCDRARRRGEPTPEVDDVISYLVAPLYFRLLFDTRPADHAYATTLIDHLLRR